MVRKYMNCSSEIALSTMRLARRSFHAVLFRHRSRSFSSACFFAFSTPSSQSLFRMAISLGNQKHQNSSPKYPAWIDFGTAHAKTPS